MGIILGLSAQTLIYLVIILRTNWDKQVTFFVSLFMSSQDQGIILCVRLSLCFVGNESSRKDIFIIEPAFEKVVHCKTSNYVIANTMLKLKLDMVKITIG